MTGHLRHILQMALTALFADWTVMGMANHQALYDIRSERLCLFILDRNDRTIASGRHTGHNQHAFLVVFVAVLSNRALPTGADRSHAGMPAKIRQVQTLRQAFL